MDKATRDGLKTIVQTNIENMQDIVNSAFIKELISDCERLEHELTELKKKHSSEANANTVLGDRLLLERKGCNCCGGELVFIRGKYPKDEQREICPTCVYERLEEIHRISDADYGKTYCSNSNDT